MTKLVVMLAVLLAADAAAAAQRWSVRIRSAAFRRGNAGTMRLALGAHPPGTAFCLPRGGGAPAGARPCRVDADCPPADHCVSYLAGVPLGGTYRCTPGGLRCLGRRADVRLRLDGATIEGTLSFRRAVCYVHAAVADGALPRKTVARGVYACETAAGVVADYGRFRARRVK